MFLDSAPRSLERPIRREKGLISYFLVLEYEVAPDAEVKTFLALVVSLLSYCLGKKVCIY